MDNTRLVYSNETGKICPSCQKPVTECICKIQGDHRETLLSELKKQGYTVKLAGG